MQAFKIAMFGIIAVSLDVGIVSVVGFHAIWVRLQPDFNNHGALRKFFGQGGHRHSLPPFFSPSPVVPVLNRMWAKRM